MTDQYEFHHDKSEGTWIAYNPDGEEIDKGDLPISTMDRQISILQDNGVTDPVREALEAIYREDWVDSYDDVRSDDS